MRRLASSLILIVLLLITATTVLARTDVHTGVFTTTSEIHYYEIYMEAGWQVELTMLCTPTNEIDPMILVFDSDGNFLWGTDDSYTACASWYSSRGIFTAPHSGNFTIWADQAASSAPGPYELTIDGDFSDARAIVAEETVVNEDPDGDGISGSRDNCPHNYNPDQEDGWGSSMGDLCDTDWYNRVGQGVAGFMQKNGTYNLHGNCTYMPDGDPRCPVIAGFDPSTFSPDNMPMEVTSSAAGSWSVIIHYLHSNNGMDVYQVNTYSSNPPQPDTLVDDRLEFHVHDGVWSWQHRGGSTQYQGGTSSLEGNANSK